jgi:hypothetical protein
LIGLASIRSNLIKFENVLNPIRSIQSSLNFGAIRSSFFTAQSDQVNLIRFFQVGLPTPAIKVDLLLIFVIIIPIALQKLKEGFSFADKSPVTDLTYAA